LESLNKYTMQAELIIFSILIQTIGLWLTGKSDLSIITVNPLLSLSQISALLGTVLLGLNLLIVTRFKFIEKIFKGLDKVYKIHHLTGAIAFILLLNHPILLALKQIHIPSLAIKYLTLSANFSYNLGVIAIWLMIILLIFTFFIKLSYQNWLFTHRLLGLPALFAALHIFYISSDVSRNPALKYWVLFWLIVGILSYFYKIFLYKYFGPHYQYSVKQISVNDDVVNLFLKANSVKKLNFHPGQFIYFQVKNHQIIKPEIHPFSIASAPNQKYLQISAKALGDYTATLQLLKPGDKIEITGPYGNFAEKFLIKKKNMIFIAGGIGITPFLSMIADFRPEDNRNIELFYISREQKNAIFESQIRQICQNKPNIKFFNYLSKEQGRIDIEKISELCKDLDKKLIFICGPLRMMESMRSQLLARGVKQQHIIMEDFSFV